MNTGALLKVLEQHDGLSLEAPREAPLAKLPPFGDNDAPGKHELDPVSTEDDGLECWLGIDVGSTSANLVLTDQDNRMVAFQYLKTYGKPLEAVRKGLISLKHQFENRMKIAGVGTTGSGRLLIGKMVGADVIKDEITSQAKAAVHLDAKVDTGL